MYKHARIYYVDIKSNMFNSNLYHDAVYIMHKL